MARRRVAEKPVTEDSDENLNFTALSLWVARFFKCNLWCYAAMHQEGMAFACLDGVARSAG
jgi:hypothetical protein